MKIVRILIVALLTVNQVCADAPELAVLQDKVKGDQPITWVFTGDSITHGALHTEGDRSYPEDFAERVRWELRRMRDVVINTGISGNRTDGILGDFDWRVARFKPDVVSVMIGMNDCSAGASGRDQFSQNLREIVRRSRTAGAIPVLHTTNTILPGKANERSDLPAYNQIIAKVAQDEHVILVDHWSIWQQAPESWFNDAIHPDGQGHRQFAIETFKTLGLYDGASPTCQPRP